MGLTLMPMIPLHTFCKQHQLPKSSVHSYLTKTMGFNLSQGMSAAAQEAALVRFMTQRSNPLPDTQVLGGDCPRQTTLPVVGGQVDLGQFTRSDSTGGLSNGADFFAGLDRFLTGIEQGMDRLEQAKESELNHTRQLKYQGLQRLHGFERRAATFGLKVELLDQLQALEERELGYIASDVQQLGESPGGATPGDRSNPGSGSSS